MDTEVVLFRKRDQVKASQKPRFLMNVVRILPERRGAGGAGRLVMALLTHLPGYVDHRADLAGKGVDTVACVSVNDAFVMGAWGREQKTGGKVRMLADGSALWTKALGLELDLIQRGMGVRSQRYSALIVDGVVKQLNVEGPGKFEVSDAATLLSQV